MLFKTVLNLGSRKKSYFFLVARPLRLVDPDKDDQFRIRTQRKDQIRIRHQNNKTGRSGVVFDRKKMVFRFDDCLFYYAHIWSEFDLLKAFGYIERVNQSFFFGKTYFTSYVRNMFWGTILYKYRGKKLGLIRTLENISDPDPTH